MNAIDLEQPGPSYRPIGSSSDMLVVGNVSQPFYNPNIRIEPENRQTDNAPRLIIPQPNLLSPPNPLLTPNIRPSIMEDGDGVVPSTPILVHRLEDPTISPQVPQSRFLFSSHSPSNSSLTSSPFSVNNAPTTPSISYTVSSIISIDEPVVDVEHEEEHLSSMPSSSRTDSQNTSMRSRRLRIRGSNRKKF